MDMDGAPKI